MDEYHYVVNVEGAVYRDGEYLLARRSEAEDHAAGAWSLIGGKVESIDGEDVLTATVRREIREEVGVEVGEAQYVESGGFVSDDGNPVVNVVFLCAYESGDARVREPEEVATVEWVGVEDLSDRDLPSFTRDYLAAIDERRRALGW